MATQTNEIDQQAVEQFLAGAAGATPQQVAVVVRRMDEMIDRKERARGPQGYVSLATMAEVARRLREV